MSLNFSTALRNALGSGMSLQEALANSRLHIFSGSQPATADADDSGTLLCSFSLSGATYTPPTQCIAKIALVGTGGSLDDISVGGSSATTGIDLLGAAINNPGTAAALVTLAVAQINAKPNPLGIYAADGGSDTIYLYAPKMVGADFNSLGLYAAATTTTVNVNASGAGATSSSTMGGDTPVQAGVAASNGLNFQVASSGAIAKETTAWQGTGLADGTAGYFRLVAGGHDYSGASTTDIRIDGSIATSGGDLTLGNLSIETGAPQTINTFTFTVPAS